MSENIPILTSKLTPPHLSGTVRRERLVSLMKGAPGKRLTAIVAGAGYGKTTLAVQAQSCWSMPTVWYRLDESDNDLAAFISYLVAAVRKHYPVFGLATLAYLRETQDLKGELKPLLLTFLSELENLVQEDLIIVLDDFHAVNANEEIRQALETLLRDLPPWVHLVLISRAKPALPLSQLRARREVLDIQEEDLAFTAPEIEQLFAELFDFSLDQVKIDAIHGKMGGWIAGLILLCHSLRGKPSLEIDKDLLNLKGPKRAIFSYLEENIFSALSPERQDFLLQTSIFPRINPRFCDRLLNINNSLNFLRYLEDHHLFTAAVDPEGNWYAYHQLFRDFLLSRLAAEFQHEAILGLHRDAALLLEESGEEDEAVRHYLLAQEYGRACTLLERVGRRLFSEGRFQLVSSYLQQIPGDYLPEHPWMLYLQAQLNGLGGHHHLATDGYNRALNSFQRLKHEEGIQSCLIESGLICFQTGNLTEAKTRFQELLARKNLDSRLRIEILGYLIYISASLEDLGPADRYFDEALTLAKDLADDRLRQECLQWAYYYRGFRYAFSGDYARVLEVLEYTKTLAPVAQPPRHSILFYLLLSVAHWGMQHYAQGYEAAREGLDMLKEGGAPRETADPRWHSPRLSLRGLRGFPETFTSWLLAYSARNAAELGKLTEAIADGEESLKRFRKIGCRLGEAFSYSVLHRAHQKSGNLLAAEQWARSGLEAINGLLMPRLAALLQLDLAESLLEKSEPEEARQLLTDAGKSLNRVNDAVRLDFLRARLAWAAGRSDEGLPRLLSALSLCRQYRCDDLAVAEKSWIVPPLVEALAQGQMPAYITKIMGRLGPDAARPLALLRGSHTPRIRVAASGLWRELAKTPAPGLRIHLLGKFRVLVEDQEISGERWKSRKAKTLFQFLIYSRAKGYVNKEVLMELLWPEEDPGLTAKRFHVALASLRKTLEPGLVKGIPSSYLARLGDAYSIALGRSGWVDLENFTAELHSAREVRDPEKALAHFLKAESLYAGDFLEEELYSEWCSEPREKFRRDYLYLAGQIVSHYYRQGNYQQCRHYAEKYLEVDKYAEDIYRILMICHGKTGDRFHLAQTFKKCRDNIARELNCRLSEETESLYRQLASH